MKPPRIISTKPIVLLWLVTGLILLSGCSPALSTQVSQQVEKLFPSIKEATRTPFQPILPTPTRTVTPTLTPEPVKELNAWIDPALPDSLVSQITLPQGVKQVEAENLSNLQIGPIRGGPEMQATWVYALVAPFPTITDAANLDEIQRAWRGEPGQSFNGMLLMTEKTRSAFTARWGPPAEGRLLVIVESELLDTAWANRTDWAIIPFEAIEPRWKVLRVDEQSPLDREFNIDSYPLTVWFGISGQQEALRILQDKTGATRLLPPGNRDPGKMTTLVMTGVTALARATGHRMDTQGTIYPARDIRDWLLTADLTHISNEVSFNTECPKANPFSTSVMFCSRPEYIELLDYIGADIIELSGNHNNDWGRRAFSYSLDLYNQREWSIFAGGANLEEARRPATLEHNGNRLAFIGCNPVGPTGAWATSDQPGSAPCGDLGWMLSEISRLRGEGYLPVVTFQYYERYVFEPSPSQERDFRAAVDSGAVIVSGSQAHFPQYMEFRGDSFIHYGLGNLFFDQMDTPVPGTRKEFVDRHVFYNGKHIHIELLTALLEDYARPRPMTEEERQNFLSEIFTSAGW